MTFVEVLASNTIHPGTNNAPVTPSTSLILGDITNHITPARVQQWTTGACAVVLGEDRDGELLLKEFKIKLGKRELISILYELLGNRSVAYSNSSDAFNGGRKYFFNMFLHAHKDQLQDFLNNHQPCPDFKLEADDVLKVIHPAESLKHINAEVHDLSLHDIYICLSYIKELEPENLAIWTDIALRVTGCVSIAGWENDYETLLQDVAAKLWEQLQDDPFRETAEEFEANHEYDLAKKHYARLEQQGLVVSRDELLAVSRDEPLAVSRDNL